MLARNKLFIAIHRPLSIRLNQKSYCFNFLFDDLDPYEHDYESEHVDKSNCDNKCGKNSDCGCNLRSGHFKCACKRGYYGPGDNCQREFYFYVFFLTSGVFRFSCFYDVILCSLPYY